MAVETCPSCQKEVPPGMQFCGWCGSEIPLQRQTVNVHSDRHVFGVPPATGLLVLGGLLLGFSVALLATGHWIVGVVLLVAALFLLSGFPQIARRPGESPVARHAVRSYDGVRARAGATIDSIAIRASARKRLGELDSDLTQLREARARGIVELGEAVFREDESEVARLRGDVQTADAAIESKERERAEVEAETEEKIDTTRTAAAPTERVVPDEEPPD
ncbi:MAG TPA: zinc ribbon domain-containing protein [Gaiellaceae bacterium]|nr:zinc ribbon domain-containing protein [Gaiellaceae bacterium]